MVNVLTILGSPRENGNCRTLLAYILQGAATGGDVAVEEVFLGREAIKPCLACDGCHRNPGCVIKDDMQAMYAKFDKADIIVVASPIYFNSVSAQLKSMIDRCQAIWASKYILNKPIIDRLKPRVGAFIATAGNPEGIAEFAPSIRVMDLFFRSINTQYYESLCVANTDKAPVKDHPEILVKASDLGTQLVREYLKK